MVECPHTSFFKGNPGDGRTKLVTTEVQRGQAEKSHKHLTEIASRRFY